MVKPCRIDDTVCVQLCREIVVSVLVRECLRRAVRVTVPVSKVLPKSCPSDHSSFEGPPEGLSATPFGGLFDRLPAGCLTSR